MDNAVILGLMMEQCRELQIKDRAVQLTMDQRWNSVVIHGSRMEQFSESWIKDAAVQ